MRGVAMKAYKSDKRFLGYDDWAMSLGVELYRESETVMELLYHLMKSKKLFSFSAILLRSKMVGFGEFLRNHKRRTDLVYEIVGEEGERTYALFCQETHVDGGYYFIRRLTELMEPSAAEDLRAAIIGVESTNYPLKSLLFIMLDTFIKAKSSEKDKIVYRTVK
jgi:hypothetical protein